MYRIITVAILVVSGALTAIYLPGAQAYGAAPNVTGMLLPRISDYNIFTGDPVNLTPGNGFQVYELATGLFTDHAEKQRLIKIPAGLALTATNDGLPQFPDGTILVKTFYYFNDKTDPSGGKRLIETRLMIKNNGQWLAGTYVWNNDQTDAVPGTNGSNIVISWIDEQASTRKITYRIPAARDCASCHNTGNSLMPVGPKIRNLNRDVLRNNKSVNQLQYLQEAGILNAVNPNRFSRLPDWQNESYPLPERVRAYLDVNCAHCHSDEGSCARSAVRFGWEVPFADTRISAKKNRIISLMEKGSMPRTGTTTVDTKALSLIKKCFQVQ
ncbi:hypothetical protein [Longitalea luteola]|uniref:hypothetical protein n=1 Tax=Longitalea luteola TaxID=2812563 RepID=UPI001A9645F6|nr:hypothetical protein [Longitalea luteola]